MAGGGGQKNRNWADMDNMLPGNNVGELGLGRMEWSILAEDSE